MKTLVVFAAMWTSFATGLSQDTINEEIERYSKLTRENPRNSEAHYRLGELFFRQNNWHSAANEFRASLNGDLKPAWTEVWSHINLGKLFDSMKQREHAINEYKLAQRTNDNTRGALDEAAKYLKDPYQP